MMLQINICNFFKIKLTIIQITKQTLKNKNKRTKTLQLKINKKIQRKINKTMKKTKLQNYGDSS